MQSWVILDEFLFGHACVTYDAEQQTALQLLMKWYAEVSTDLAVNNNVVSLAHFLD